MNAAFAVVLLASPLVLTAFVQEVKADEPADDAAPPGPICETNYDEGFGYAYGQCDLQCGVHSAGQGTSHAFGGAIGELPGVRASNGCIPDAGCIFVAACFGVGEYNHNHGVRTCSAEAWGLLYVNVIGGCSAVDGCHDTCNAPFAATGLELQLGSHMVHHIWAKDFTVASLSIGDLVCAPADGTQPIDEQVPTLNHCVAVMENALWMFAGPADYYPFAFYCAEGAGCVEGKWI